MKIEKRESGDDAKRANSGDYVTPKVARLILSGFATTIATAKNRMWINTPDGYPRIVLIPEVLKRSSRYKLSEAIGARNILIATNEALGPTHSIYLSTVDPAYNGLMCDFNKATGKDVLALEEVTNWFLPQMGLELRIDYGGVAIVEKQ